MARIPEGLADDLWVEIYDFTGQLALSRVCQRLWKLLHKRHQTLRVSGDRLPQWVEWCRDQVTQGTGGTTQGTGGTTQGTRGTTQGTRGTT